MLVGSYEYKMAEAYKEGYDEDFIEDAHQDYVCAVCQFPYREPFQLKTCGHRFCKDCIMRVRR